MTPPPLTTREQAFTLIELMVVMILMAVMAAMIVPEMRGSYQDALLRSTGRALVDGFDVAYSQAVSLNQTHRLRLDRPRNRYVIERQIRDDPRGGEFVPLRDIPGGDGELDPRIQILFAKTAEGGESDGLAEPPPPSAENSRTEGAPQSPGGLDDILFYPDGTADPGEIVLQDQDGFRLGLQINPATARVHLVELGRK